MVRNLLPVLAGALVVASCSNSSATTTTTLTPVTSPPTTPAPTTTVTPTTTTTTTTIPATTTTAAPARPPGFEGYPGAEYIGAPMPEVDLSAETYADVAATIEDLDRMWAWINANPGLVTPDLAALYFAGPILESVTNNAKENAEAGQLVLSGEGFFGEIDSLSPVFENHGLETALPLTGSTVQIVAARAEPSWLLTEQGVQLNENEGFPAGNVYRLVIAYDGQSWRLADLQFLEQLGG